MMFENYYNFINIFSKQKIDKLPFHWKYDHRIEFEKDKKASIQALFYCMFEQELQFAKIYFEKHLNKKFIIAFSILFASSILFAKKPNKKLRFCVDYGKLNKITKKIFYFLIFDLMTRLTKTKYLTKIDIRYIFNRIKMTIERNKDLTTFHIRFEFYKYFVLFFDLTNELFTFQNFINNILMKFFDDFVLAYLNNILIYNNSLKKHKKHIQKILQKLKKAEIQVDINKCEFHMAKTKFLKISIKKIKFE